MYDAICTMYVCAYIHTYGCTVSKIPVRIEIGFRGGPVPMLPSAVDGSLIDFMYMRVCNCAF